MAKQTCRVSFVMVQAAAADASDAIYRLSADVRVQQAIEIPALTATACRVPGEYNQ